MYCLTAGKQYLPGQVASERQRRNLQKTDEEYRRRIELLQDFEFPEASQRVRLSDDGNCVLATGARARAGRARVRAARPRAARSLGSLRFVTQPALDPGPRARTTGTYPPAARLFDLRELSMRWERRLTCEAVDVVALAPDCSKLAFLLADRTLALHAPYGHHAELRVPKFGRSARYAAARAALLVGAAGPELYQLDLQEGRFLRPLELGAAGAGVNALALHGAHGLLGAARRRRARAAVDVRAGDAPVRARGRRRGRGRRGGRARRAAAAAAARAPARRPRSRSTGSRSRRGRGRGRGRAVRRAAGRPLHVKAHQYGLPIVSVQFHSSDALLAARGARARGGAGGGAAARRRRGRGRARGALGRREARQGGTRAAAAAAGGGGAARVRSFATLANVEAAADVRDVCVARVGGGGAGGGGAARGSGLLLRAGEQARLMAYFVPALGPAPAWCSHVDALTEELEESSRGAVFDDYQFVTEAELDELGARHLAGQSGVRAYMHGYFVDAKLYRQLHALAKPFAYDEWRKQKAREKQAAKAASRISAALPPPKLPRVNAKLAERLMKATARAARDAEAAAAADEADDDSDDSEAAAAERRKRKRKNEKGERGEQAAAATAALAATAAAARRGRR